MADSSPPLASFPAAGPEDVAEADKLVAPPPPDSKPHEVKDLPLVEKTSDPAAKKPAGGSFERDVALAEVEKEKRFSFIKAWEESEKTKVDNKAQKKLSAVAAWENSQKASLEAKLKKMEEQLEKKKAEYGEKMKNKVAAIHKQAEEKKAVVEAQRAEQILTAEDAAAKYRATGQTPKKLLGCF